MTLVRAICHQSVDLVVSGGIVDVLADMAELQVAPGVTFSTSSGEHARLLEAVLSGVEPGRLSWSGGGPASNCLATIARLALMSDAASTVWTGPGEIEWTGRLESALGDFRKLRTSLEMSPPQFETEWDGVVLCFAPDGGETSAIRVPRRRPSNSHVADDADLTVLRLADLAAYWPVLSKQSCALAVLTADHLWLDAKEERLFEDVVTSGRVRYIFGGAAEYLRLGIRRVVPRGSSVLSVATDGAQPVRVDSAGQSLSRLVVPRVEGWRNSLGAGDAYAGAFIHAHFVESASISHAHEVACAEAHAVCRERSARVIVEVAPSDVFGRLIERPVPKGADEDVYQAVRESSGLAIIACGQPGVDQAGLHGGRSAGLATYAVVPRGGRTETTEDGRSDDFGSSRVIELSSESYRYTTWLNVFVSDGTLLVDPAKGEGSAETRRAAAYLNRPLFECGPEFGPSDLADLAVWTRQHGVRVLNVAGNRASKLSPTELDQVRRSLDEAIRWAGSSLVAGRDRQVAAAMLQDGGAPGVTRLGVPTLREIRVWLSAAMATSGLWDRKVTTEIDDGALYVRASDDLELYFGRSLDLVRMMRAGHLDCAVVGSDMLMEAEWTGTVLPLGIFACALSLVGAPDNELDGFSTVLSQYPGIAARRFPDSRIVPILGSAEGWLHGFDGGVALDTWRTGRTAASYGYGQVLKVADTCLSVAAGPGGLTRGLVELLECIFQSIGWTHRSVADHGWEF